MGEDYGFRWTKSNYFGSYVNYYFGPMALPLGSLAVEIKSFHLSYGKLFALPFR